MKTKNIYAILLTFLIPALVYGNLVNNPSMEGNFIYQDPLGDVAEYWTGWTTGDYLEGAFSEGSYVHDANKSQEIHWNGSGMEQFGKDGIYQQISSLQPGQNYQLSVWFKFRFESWGIDMGDGEITCSIGTDPNGGIDPQVVAKWGSASDYAYGDLYQGPWFNGITFFLANTSTATIFIKVDGYGNAEDPCPLPSCPIPWDAYCYIDDVIVQPIQISQDSTVTATTPIPINGASYSEVTITVLDSNSNPVEGIPAWEIDVNCTGSGNTIIGPDQPTDANGQTTIKITSTVVETKTVSATVLGTLLSDTAAVRFCESSVSKLRASDGAASDYFYSVAINGNTALVGAHFDDDNGSNSGSAYVFQYDGSTWVEETKLLASDGAASDDFGHSVAISGATALVGAHQDDDAGTDSGSAYLYDVTTGSQITKLTASDAAAGDEFGIGVALSGATALVGAHQDDDNGSKSGSAYIFRYDGSNWIQQDKLLASDGAASDYFGISVAIDGNTALVGAHGNDDAGSDSGSAYVFRYNGSNWIQEAKLLASDAVPPSSWDYFGRSVAISGTTALVGASSNDDAGGNSGSAYIFRYDGSNWVQEPKLLASDGAASDYFGASVSIDGNTALVGAYGDDDNGSNSGSAYVFPALIGDLDTDSDVDLTDLSILANQWQQEPGAPSADIAPCGGDYIIDFLDLKVFCDLWLEGAEL